MITGLGVVTGLAHAVSTFWERLCRGESGVGPITLFDTSEFKVHFGGQVRDFDPDAIFGVKESRRLDRFAQFAMVAADQAVADSGIDFGALPPYRCGVIIGSGIGGLTEFETQHSVRIHKGPAKISPFTIPKLMVNAGSGQVSIKYGLKGPSSAVATACTSAANAIGDAMRLIQHNVVDAMITGGSEAAITHMGLGGFANMRALSTRNEEPTKASRPFDKDRDGFVLSEGAGLLTLEAEEIARARGARIYAELIGYGMSSDGTHITAPDPDGRGAEHSMKFCLQNARVNPDQVGYMNAHGTSTGLGDVAETKAMKTVFGSHAEKLMVSSTKSQLGHLLGASGGVELVACTMALTTGIIPPTINLDEPDPECDLDYVPNQAREVRVDHIMSNTFGFGGHNASLLIRRYEG